MDLRMYAGDVSPCKMCKGDRVRELYKPRTNMDTHTGQRSSFGLCRTEVCRLLLVLVFVAAFQSSNGFNLDTKKFVEFRGDNPGSYFGYSVAMLNLDERNQWLLFGAPRDNSQFLPNVTRPGAIYKCTILQNGNGHSCEELFVDDSVGPDSAIFNGITRLFEHGHDGQWLGGAIDVHKNKGIITCASRWQNSYFLKFDNSTYMNGLCYELPLDMGRNNIRTIPALIDAKRQILKINNITKYDYGMGGMGMSVHYTEQGHDLLLGAPGLRTWTGGFVDLRGNKNYLTDYVQQATENSEMLGYAITSGEFFGNGMTYFAVGAPRDELTGKVYLYRGSREEFVVENADSILDGTEGTTITMMPVNGFFGAALCSCDVNNDGRDDLMVGAPLYAHSNGKDAAVEEGIVLVYLGGNDDLVFSRPEVVTGSKATMGRFGTAMACLGDINKDKYNDVVIGAPYEQDNQGAIYIYNGCKTGLWPYFTQRISAAVMANGLSSFGISFSKPADMNEDGVNDIAVGAYLSDRAYLMFGQAVINMESKITADVKLIDIATNVHCVSSDGKDQRCFNVEVCLIYTDIDFAYIDILMTITLDVYMEGYHRIAFIDNNGNAVDTPLRISNNEKQCSSKQIYIKSTADLVTPVLIQATYKVIDINNNIYIPPTLNSFNGSNPSKDTFVTKTVLEFKKNCPNNLCHTDLMLETNAVFDDTDGFFVLGTPSITLEVKITKTGDPSYSSNVFIAFPKSLQFQKVTKISGDPDITCGYIAEEALEEQDSETDTLESLINKNIPSKTDEEEMVGCSYGNPLYNDTGVSFNLIFGVPDKVMESQLDFRLNTTTLSDEVNAADNVQTVQVGVKHQVTTELIGVSRPSYIRIDDSSSDYLMTHVFELRNNGPSSLPLADLTIRYPQVQSGGGVQLFLNKTTWSCLPPCKVTCSFTEDLGSSPTVYSEEVGPTYYVKESSSAENIGALRKLKTIKALDCLESTCTAYLCTISNIPARESAVVSLEFGVDGSVLDVVAGGEARTAKSEGQVKLKETGKLITDALIHYTIIPTQILPLAQPPQKLPWWVILLSVLGGVLFILIISIILWKCGFFRRKQREQMQQMQHQGEVEKMMPEGKEDL